MVVPLAGPDDAAQAESGFAFSLAGGYLGQYPRSYGHYPGAALPGRPGAAGGARGGGPAGARQAGRCGRGGAVGARALAPAAQRPRRQAGGPAGCADLSVAALRYSGERSTIATPYGQASRTRDRRRRFIGSHVADSCLELGMEVVATDDLIGRLHRERRPRVRSGCRATCATPTSSRSLWDDGPFDYVYHLGRLRGRGAVALHPRLQLPQQPRGERQPDQPVRAARGRAASCSPRRSRSTAPDRCR